MSYRILFFILIFFMFSQLYGGKLFTIVIDPGHGGNNTGATYEDILEKHLTLDLSMRIRTIFYKHPLENISIHFTRTGDVDLPVKKRVEMIENLKPDLFITIHFNSQKLISTSRGFEIYYPPDKLVGNTDIKAENYPLNMFTQKHGFSLFDDTTVPGLLLEMAYVSSPEDRACIENSQFMNDAAWFVYEAVKQIVEK